MKKVLGILVAVVLCAIIASFLFAKFHFKRAKSQAHETNMEALQSAEADLLERFAELETKYPDWKTRDTASDLQFKLSCEMVVLDVTLYRQLIEVYNSLFTPEYKTPAPVEAVINQIESRKY